MRIFDSLRRILPRRASIDPKSRWKFLTDGTCRDNSRDEESVWRIGVNRFESLLQGVEKRTENRNKDVRGEEKEEKKTENRAGPGRRRRTETRDRTCA